MTVGRIAFVSAFVPPEWIAAHGLNPLRVLPSLRSAADACHQGRCAYAVATAVVLRNLLATQQAEAVVFTTTCDQMRRAPDDLADDPRVHVMTVPHTWQSPLAQKAYGQELDRLGNFLCRQGGATPSPEHLAQTLVAWDTARQQLLAQRDALTPAVFATAIRDLMVETSRCHPVRSIGVNPGRRGFPVAILGGPLCLEDHWLFEVLTAAGTVVALDASETGERCLPRRFDRRRLGTEPRAELADAYFGCIPDIFRRPNSQVYAYLQTAIRQRGIAALILLRRPWCDLWQAEEERITTWSPVPVAVVDLTGGEDAEGRTRTRIEALVETLRSRS